jgi:hypothetical protein
MISMFFNLVILMFWSCDYGTCPVSGPKNGWSSRKSKKKKKKAEADAVSEGMEGTASA